MSFKYWLGMFIDMDPPRELLSAHITINAVYPRIRDPWILLRMGEKGAAISKKGAFVRQDEFVYRRTSKSE